MDIILAQSLCTEATAQLKIFIERFYSLFVKLAPDFVKPKLHFLLHFPRLIEFYGPLRHLWCMRFESFHKKIKLLAHNCQNFKNICLTVTKRIQSFKCYEQCSIACLMDDTALEGKPTTMDQLPIEIAEFMQYDMDIPESANLISLKRLVENGVTYSVNNIYILDFIHNKPMFIHVKRIVIFGSVTLICGLLLVPLYFNSQFHSYVVQI
uniref:DUF4218 domain-containing protein n=1 Tax=Ciona intestinalis TaxID=7719 RepID=H2XUM2_CIOIN